MILGYKNDLHLPPARARERPRLVVAGGRCRGGGRTGGPGSSWWRPCSPTRRWFSFPFVTFMPSARARDPVSSSSCRW